MEAARYEFAEAGLCGARVEEIALRAGVTKQLVYHYYLNKTNLYVAVLDEAIARITTALLEVNYDELGPTAALTLFFERIFDQYQSHPYLAGFQLDDSIHSEEHRLAHERSTFKILALVKQFKAIVERGQREGIFRPDVDAHMLYGTGVMLVTGCFTHGVNMSELLPVNLGTAQGRTLCCQFSIQLMLNALHVCDHQIAITQH
jgi:TetR/AcrR family transcriptional regulator